MTLLSGDLVFKTPSTSPGLGSCRIPDQFDDDDDDRLNGGSIGSPTAAASTSRASGRGSFSRMGHWMTSSTRRSWLTASLKDMLRKEDAARKKSEWYVCLFLS